MPAYNFKDLTGNKFGKLTVIERVENDRHNRAMWKCLCDCSKSTVVKGNFLLLGHTKSCGCLHKELLIARKTKHGHTVNKKQTPTFRCWVSMIKRCTKETEKAYPRYGGRGIKVCERWLSSYSNFLEDMGERPSTIHSIDRIDVNGNYEPNNCRWAPPVVQAQNKRTSNKYGQSGIYYYNNRYLAKITFTRDGVKSNVHLGSFLTCEDAIEARKLAEARYWNNTIQGI